MVSPAKERLVPRPQPTSGPAHRSLENLASPLSRREEQVGGEMALGYRGQALQQPRNMAFSHDAIPRPSILDSSR